MTDRSKKVSELPAHLNAPADNLLPIVANPGTANAETRKITLLNLFANVATPVRINSTLRATGNSVFNGNINVDGDVIGTGNTSLIAGQDSFIKLVSSDGGKSVYVNTTAAYIQSGNTTTFTINDGLLDFPSSASLNRITFNRAVFESSINDGLTISTTEVGSGQSIEIAYIDTNSASKNSSLFLANSEAILRAGGIALTIGSDGETTIGGTFTADNFSGNGALIVSINAASISSGTLDTARLPSTANISTGVNVGSNVRVTTSGINIGNSTANVSITGDGFVGVGEYITYINATNITDGTLATELLPATINVATAVNISGQTSLNTSSLSIINGFDSAVINTTGVFIGGAPLKDTADLTVTGTTIASNTNVTITTNEGASTWEFGVDGDLTLPENSTIRLFNGDSAIKPIGPFTDDADAALYGVIVGNMYYKADGTVHVRLV